jgi:murein DD-endopeptidase MepM/ murein hydrolase activator NlpD
MIKLKHILTEATDNLLQTFPIGSKNFNIGYDSSMKEPETGLNRDTVIQNSDYGDGDVAHRSRGGHLGIDIFAPKGEPVVAPVTGIVIKSSNLSRGAGGKFVTIDKNGISFYHAHLDQTYVEDGQEVKAGQLIGTCGDTGNAAGTHPHVHFSIYRTKEGYSRGSINPWPSLQNVMYNVTKSDKNLDVLHKKLQKLGFDLGNEQKFGINGPKTQTALLKLNKTYDQKLQTGGLTSKISSFLSSIINSDIAQSVLGNNKSKDKSNIQNNDVSATDMPSRVISFLKNKGLTTSQASGIAGNMAVESGFEPDAVGDAGTSYGLVQWHADRWTKLKQYCAKNNYDVSSVSGQLEYLWYELKSNSRLGYAELIKQTNPRDAAEIFAKYFERPANISIKRMDNAENYYNEYTKNAADKIA